MVAKILELIDKSDFFEIVRDEIAAILAVESEQPSARCVLRPRLCSA